MDDMRRELAEIDRKIIRAVRVISAPAARIAIAVVFAWFGFLKMIHMSPANPLVRELLSVTLPSLSFESFIVWFGAFEVLIGVSFLVPRLMRAAIALLVLHLAMAVLPLVLLPDMSWQAFLVPTLEGQYIIKNIVIVALAIGIAAHLHPLHKPRLHRWLPW